MRTRAQLVRTRAQLVRTRAQLVRTRAQLVRTRAQLVRARAQLVRSINSIQVNFGRRCSPMSSAVRCIDALLSRSLATWKLESVSVDGRLRKSVFARYFLRNHAI